MSSPSPAIFHPRREYCGLSPWGSDTSLDGGLALWYPHDNPYPPCFDVIDCQLLRNLCIHRLDLCIVDVGDAFCFFEVFMFVFLTPLVISDDAKKNGTSFFHIIGYLIWIFFTLIVLWAFTFDGNWQIAGMPGWNYASPQGPILWDLIGNPRFCGPSWKASLRHLYLQLLVCYLYQIPQEGQRISYLF